MHISLYKYFLITIISLPLTHFSFCQTIDNSIDESVNTINWSSKYYSTTDSLNALADSLEFTKISNEKNRRAALENYIGKLKKLYTYPEDLNDDLIRFCENDEEKVFVIFRWATLFISYNTSQHNPAYVLKILDKMKKEKSSEDFYYKCAQETMRKKTGVCANYAIFLDEMFKINKLQSKVVNGFVTPKSIPHAWNAVKINNNWYILDATWAAGYGSGFNNTKWTRNYDPSYYLVTINKGFATHKPED